MPRFLGFSSGKLVRMAALGLRNGPVSGYGCLPSSLTSWVQSLEPTPQRERLSLANCLRTSIITKQKKNSNQKQQSLHCQQWSSAIMRARVSCGHDGRRIPRGDREEIPLRTVAMCHFSSPSKVPFHMHRVQSRANWNLTCAPALQLDVRSTVKPRSLPAGRSPVSCSLNASLDEPIPRSLLYSLLAWSQQP